MGAGLDFIDTLVGPERAFFWDQSFAIVIVISPAYHHAICHFHLIGHVARKAPSGSISFKDVIDPAIAHIGPHAVDGDDH